MGRVQSAHEVFVDCVKVSDEQLAGRRQLRSQLAASTEHLAKDLRRKVRKHVSE